MTRVAPLLLPIFALACTPTPPPAGDAARPARAPLIGARANDAADVDVDVADRECRVVVRRADRLVDARGCGVGVIIDVAEPLLADPGATPGVLFRADGGAWAEVTAADAGVEPPPGFRRFSARFAAA